LLTAEPGPIGLYQHVINLNNYLIYFLFSFSCFPKLRGQWGWSQKNWHKKYHFRFWYFSTNDRPSLYYKSQG